MFGISVHLGITQCGTQVLSYQCLNVLDFMEVSGKSISLILAENHTSALGYVFLAIMNVHWIEAFLPSDACKVMRNPSRSIPKSTRCLWGWLSSPAPTQGLEIKRLKSPCSWSCQGFVYPLSEEKSKQRLVFFYFFVTTWCAVPNFRHKCHVMVLPVMAVRYFCMTTVLTVGWKSFNRPNKYDHCPYSGFP